VMTDFTVTAPATPVTVARARRVGNGQPYGAAAGRRF
jgi:hypothetical protein